MSASEILRELDSLKDEKTKIEHKISALEAQLREINLQNDAAPPNASSSSSYPTNGLTQDMIHRYSRHLVLPSFGVQGQANLLKSSILVVGAGGLGAPALLYFAASGVGRLGVIDHDVVELNNMHRQVIHTEAYVGKPKVKSAAAACCSINSTIQVVEHEEALQTSNALEILSKYDIIVDATDNAPTRYLISDCCVVLGKSGHISSGEYPALKMFKSSHDVVRGGPSRLALNQKANKEKKESIIQDDLWAVETSSCDSTADEPIEISSSPSTPTRLKNQYHLRPENLILQRTVAGRPQTQKVSNNAVSHLEVQKELLTVKSEKDQKNAQNTSSRGNLKNKSQQSSDVNNNGSFFYMEMTSNQSLFPRSVYLVNVVIGILLLIVISWDVLSC